MFAASLLSILEKTPKCTFLPHEGGDDGTKIPVKPKTQIEIVPEKAEYQISWPNIIRFDRVFKNKLSLDISKMDTLTLSVSDTRISAELAPIIDGQTDLTKCTEIDLEKLSKELRMQTVIFKATAHIYEIMQSDWQGQGTKFSLLGQVIKLVEEYLKSDVIVFDTGLFQPTGLRKNIMYMINMNKIVQHLWSYIKLQTTDKLVPVFDSGRPVRFTKDMMTWYTTKPCFITQKSHISHCVFDSSWESTESYKLEHNNHVKAWVKNDHLGFEIIYVFDGVVRKYYPDFLIKLDNGKTLVLEVKGQEKQKDKEKRKALAEWIEAVNNCGDFGEWCNDVSYNVGDIDGIIAFHAAN